MNTKIIKIIDINDLSNFIDYDTHISEEIYNEISNRIESIFPIKIDNNDKTELALTPLHIELDNRDHDKIHIMSWGVAQKTKNTPFKKIGNVRIELNKIK